MLAHTPNVREGRVVEVFEKASERRSRRGTTMRLNERSGIKDAAASLRGSARFKEVPATVRLSSARRLLAADESVYLVVRAAHTYLLFSAASLHRVSLSSAHANPRLIDLGRRAALHAVVVKLGTDARLPTIHSLSRKLIIAVAPDGRVRAVGTAHELSIPLGKRPVARPVKKATAGGIPARKTAKKDGTSTPGKKPATKTATKRAPAKKKAPAGAAPAKKAAAKRAPAKKAPTKKAAAKRAPAKKAPTKKAAAKRAAKKARPHKAAPLRAPTEKGLRKTGSRSKSLSDLSGDDVYAVPSSAGAGETARPTRKRPASPPAIATMESVFVRTMTTGLGPPSGASAVLEHLSNDLREEAYEHDDDALESDDALPEARSDSDDEPPREAFARLEAPEVVAVGQTFALTVGISPVPMPGVAGGPMKVPAATVGPYLLTVQVVAEGFELASAAQHWRNELEVSAAQPYPFLQLQLRTSEQTERLRARQIQVLFSVDGHTIGLASRPLAVVREPSDALDRVEPKLPQPVQINVPAEGRPPPDLTVRILKGEIEGHLLWTFDTPLPGIPLPDSALERHVGGSSSLREFAKRMVQDVNREDEKVGIYEFMVGKGQEIADAVPSELWPILRAVKNAVGSRDVTLLMLSADAYVPWELAVMDPPLYATRPAFLGSQVAVGRWFYDQERPELQAPVSVKVSSLAVISGVYGAKPNWRRLPEAEQEATTIAQLYAATPHGAEFAAVRALLRADPGADVLHFAVHGSYDQSGIQDGIVLVDGRVLSPTHVRAFKPLRRGPLVFLNACQVGSGNEVLGDCAGMAAAFLNAGAAAVIAPLWSIKDSIAGQVALDFYAQVRAGTRPSEFVRTLREQFVDSADTLSATRLAYQYFGHPCLQVQFDSD